jgi:hypothetical protein
MDKFSNILRDVEGAGGAIEKEFVDDENRRWYHKSDYRYVADQEKFYNLVTRTLHTKESVNASISKNTWTVVVDDEADEVEDDEQPRKRKVGRPKKKVKRIPPSEEIKVANYTEGMAWIPGGGTLVPNLVVSGSGAIHVEKANCVNTFIPPPVFEKGDPEKATPWIEHCKLICNDDPILYDRFFNVLAQTLQDPGTKCNGAIVLTGNQGVGKDAALFPLRYIFGSWNVSNVEPDALTAQFKPFFRSLVVIVDETHSNEEMKTTDFYNTLKPMLAAPPEYLPMNDKFQPIRYVANVMRFFITTNDKLSIYIPEDDRRMFVIDCYRQSNWHIDEGKPDYFKDLFNWFSNEDGFAHISAWLRARDISQFNPKAPPEFTAGKDVIRGSWGEPDDAIAYALAKLAALSKKEAKVDGNVIQLPLKTAEPLRYPPVVFGQELLNQHLHGKGRSDESGYNEVRGLMKTQRRLDHRMARSGYAPSLTNPHSERWSFTRNKGDPFRSKTAYVNKKLYEQVMLKGGKDAVYRLIEDHGAVCALRGSNSDDADTVSKVE